MYVLLLLVLSCGWQLSSVVSPLLRDADEEHTGIHRHAEICTSTILLCRETIIVVGQGNVGYMKSICSIWLLHTPIWTLNSKKYREIWKKKSGILGYQTWVPNLLLCEVWWKKNTRKSILGKKVIKLEDVNKSKNSKKKLYEISATILYFPPKQPCSPYLRSRDRQLI